jgi:hypothetical protein
MPSAINNPVIVARFTSRCERARPDKMTADSILSLQVYLCFKRRFSIIFIFRFKQVLTQLRESAGTS